MSVVSVIIPNYNHARYLLQRINSVLNQTFTDFELIILDDCSTDNSREIIEGYRQHPKISQIVYNTENTGNPFMQWDKGIQLAKGEYVWIAESDDWCEPTLLETLMKAFDDDACVLAYCQSYCVFDDGRIKFQSNHTQLAEYVDGKLFISRYIVPRNPIFNAGMAVWKRKAYGQISKEYISYTHIGDYVFWTEIARCGNVFISGRLLNYFRSHNSNTSPKALQSGMSFLDHLPVYKKLHQRGLINIKEYNLALKKIYVQFRQAEGTIAPANVALIKRAFSDHAASFIGLTFFYHLKNIQQFSKKLLRV